MLTPARWLNRPRRLIFAGFAVVALLALLFLPPVRAAADQLLQIFRVQKVMFVPTSMDRIRELEQLQFDPQNLFMGEPKLVNTPAPPRPASSAAEASAAAGFAVEEPALFPGATTGKEFVVNDRHVVQVEVDVDASRQLLGLLGVDDVEIPDALGAAPIVADVPPAVETTYHGSGFTLKLFQGRSPDVNLPDGVDLAQLGKAGLRVLGMDPVRAEALSRQIDWSSTLVFPFPADLSEVRQVSVGGTDGLLVGGSGDGPARWHLYWQRGDRFYILDGEGVNEGEMIAVAESVQ